MSQRITFLFLFPFLISLNLYAQPWTEQNSGVTVQLTSVSAIDYTNAWVCGYSGTVLRTTNQGVNWLNVSGNGIPSTIQLVNVFGVNSNIALVAGYIGTNTWVYRTNNAGANWTQVFTQTGGFINALWIKLDSTGFMMGDPVGGRWSLWRTTNNGAAWDSTGLYLSQSGTEASWNNSMVVAQNRIWFGTNNTRVYYSSNNGASWSVQTTTGETSIYGIWFDPNGMAIGYCGGANVLKTTNYGTGWSSIGSLGTGNIAGITGLPMFSGVLWYVKSGNNNIYWGNGLGNWNVAYTAPAGTYRHITVDRNPNWPNHGYAVRTNGGISHTLIFVEKIKSIGGKLPESFSLSQNYPNPFNPVTKIRFDIPSSVKRETSNVKIMIYDMLGREVVTLVNEELKPGTYEVEWDGTNYPSGVYYYTLTAGDASTSLSMTETRKMVLIK